MVSNVASAVFYVGMLVCVTLILWLETEHPQEEEHATFGLKFQLLS